jgi:hypothetical protein
MTEQVNIAVNLGDVPPPLPEIVTLRQFAVASPVTPWQIIEDIFHRGCKMILNGSSKPNKSWCLLGLARPIAVAAKEATRTKSSVPPNSWKSD